MRGELIGVWSETWREIWSELAEQERAPDDLYCELYRELSFALKTRPKPEVLADIIDNPLQSKEAFQAIRADELAGEQVLVIFFEKTYEALEELAGDELANPYFNLLAAFIEKFSLRYELRQPCTLCPTLPGMFASLLRDLRVVTSQDPHLDSLMKDFENAVRDLRTDCSDSRIKTCIHKQMNLIEAIGARSPNVNKTTLGEICDQLGSWPHVTMKEALKRLYGFASDYPGIRHGGNPGGAIRAIDMRDMVAMSILLAGFIPYLTDQISADTVYRGT